MLPNKKDFIDYGKLIRKAMVSIVKDALIEVEKSGSNKKYCFMFEINTRHSGVVLPQKVLMQYPDTITLIIQYQFSNLKVDDKFFSVNLSFGGEVHNVIIPFDAILIFSDRENDFEIRLGDDIFDPESEEEFYINYEYEGAFEDNENKINFSNNLVNFNDLKKVNK